VTVMLYRVPEFPSVYRFLRRIFNSDRIRPILLSGIEYHAGMRVLDIGCGTGELSECFEPEDYVGIDVSEAYIQAARQHYKGTFYAMDVGDYRSSRQSFSRAFMNGVFHHLPDEKVEVTLSALAHILKPGGFFFCNRSRIAIKVLGTCRGIFFAGWIEEGMCELHRSGRRFWVHLGRSRRHGISIVVYSKILLSCCAHLAVIPYCRLLPQLGDASLKSHALLSPDISRRYRAKES
jgi:SAM-dependent methyltransferase